MTDSDSLRDRQARRLFFTWSAQRKARGFEITDARGARFEVAGKGWVWDLESQVYNVNVGHKHPHVQRRMIEQIEAMPACAPHAVLPIRAELGELLHEVSGFERAFLTTGGAEAVENAIKIARLATGRTKVIARANSYHGATLATLELGGDPRRRPFEATFGEALHIDDAPVADLSERPSTWLQSFDTLLAKVGANQVAAVVLEGLTGTNGMQEPPHDFWPGVRARCDEHGILLVDDEIFSGFGRTGRWFAREHWDVQPDMMVVGKGMTSGCAPLAGVLVSEAIAERFDDDPLVCGLTHYAHPVSCAAAVASIEVLKDENLVANAATMGQRLSAALDKVALGGMKRGVRGRGLQRAIELDRPAQPFAEALWDAGVYAPFRNELMFVCPPLCIVADEVDEVVSLLERCARALTDAT